MLVQQILEVVIPNHLPIFHSVEGAPNLLVVKTMGVRSFVIIGAEYSLRDNVEPMVFDLHRRYLMRAEILLQEGIIKCK